MGGSIRTRTKGKESIKSRGARVPGQRKVEVEIGKLGKQLREKLNKEKLILLQLF